MALLRIRVSIVPILLMLGSCASSEAWPMLTPGPGAVGYHNHVWYPAASADGSLLRFRDLVPLLETWDETLRHAGWSDERMVVLFDTILVARENATAAPSRRRLTIALAEGETDADYGVVAEWLASYGFEVTTQPDDRGTPIDVRGTATMDFLRDSRRARISAINLLRSL